MGVTTPWYIFGLRVVLAKPRGLFGVTGEVNASSSACC